MKLPWLMGVLDVTGNIQGWSLSDPLPKSCAKVCQCFALHSTLRMSGKGRGVGGGDGRGGEGVGGAVGGDSGGAQALHNQL